VEIVHPSNAPHPKVWTSSIVMPTSVYYSVEKGGRLVRLPRSSDIPRPSFRNRSLDCRRPSPQFHSTSPARRSMSSNAVKRLSFASYSQLLTSTPASLQSLLPSTSPMYWASSKRAHICRCTLQVIAPGGRATLSEQRRSLRVAGRVLGVGIGCLSKLEE
jgi:hypothetical protein